MELVELERAPVTRELLPSGAALAIAQNSTIPLNGGRQQRMQSLGQVFEFDHKARPR